MGSSVKDSLIHLPTDRRCPDCNGVLWKAPGDWSVYVCEDCGLAWNFWHRDSESELAPGEQAHLPGVPK